MVTFASNRAASSGGAIRARRSRPCAKDSCEISAR
ncbi:hypothetical protein ACFSXZ_10075 [Amycolatopsis pigmentata]|uniref:Uncharacterized protein n=1 Tax=Amycolatopsis pigmentata TaxID=450801 RepID=A0ABW5FNR2_9PSEU